jgi:hypothetical protein
VVNTLTKGQAIVGKLHGNIAATAGSITSTEIAAKGVSAANLALANTKIAIGSTAGGGVAYALSGDVTMTNAGVTTIGAKKVTAAKMALANTKVMIGSTAGAAAEYALSGDVTMTNAGVVTIGAKKVAATKMSLSNTKIAIGSTASGGVEYALSGDVTMSNTGAVTIGAKKVTAAKVAIANTKVLIGSTAGAAAEYALSGDVTMTNGGNVTIAAAAVTSTMVAGKAITPAKMGLANTKVAIGSTAGAGAEYALSGDVTMTNGGVVTIGSSRVTAGKIAGKAVTPGKLGLANTKIVIGSTAGAGAEYALSGDITMTNAGVTAIGTKKVHGAMLKADWSTLSNTTKSVSAVSVAAVNQGYFITDVGTSLGLVITGAGACISAPTAGDWVKFTVASKGSTRPIHLKSTAATFDGTRKFALFNAVGDSLVLEAISATRWIPVFNTSVTYSTST